MAADRVGVVLIIAELHRLDIRAFRLDSEDGLGGERMVLADLVAFAGSLRGQAA